uniref:Signal recognition particle 14 kDa protein n=1 Tax=Equus caballus TaxID=9796 RepID=A0A3Q2ICP6_HORSE
MKPTQPTGPPGRSCSWAGGGVPERRRGAGGEGRGQRPGLVVESSTSGSPAQRGRNFRLELLEAVLTERSRGRWDGAAGERADDGRTKPIPRKGSVEGFEPSDNKCLLRATDGKKKISTVVSSKEVNKFQMAYSNLLRANMDGLKKRDKKSKSKKSKAAQ